MSAKPKIVKFGEVEDDAGRNRLSLLYESVVFDGEEGGYNFHSLVWDKKNGKSWDRFLTITQETFEEGVETTRWIDKL